jgi:WD40 repeat protein
MNAAFHAWREGRVVRARESLDKQVPIPGAKTPDLRGFDWRYLWGITRPVELFTLTNAANWGLALAPDGQTIAGYVGNELCLWSVPARKKLATLSTNYSWAYYPAFSPNGRTLAAPNGNEGANYVVDLWDVQNRRRIRDQVQQQVLGVTFSPDGQTLVTTGGEIYHGLTPGEVRLWDVSSGKERLSLKGLRPGCIKPRSHPTAGARNLGRRWNRSVWAAATGSLVTELPRHNGFVFPVAFSRRRHPARHR